MKISTLMSRDVTTCRTDDHLERAAQLMWEHDIGCLPVVDDHGRVAGMLTDRDVCMAAYTRGTPLREIPTSTAMATPVHTCRPDDAVLTAEQTMRAQQIRRLPVVDATGRPIAVISLNDLAIAAHRQALPSTEALATLAAVCAPRTRSALGTGAD